MHSFPFQIINNKPSCYGTNKFPSNSNLNNFEYGLKEDYKKKLIEQYNMIGKLAQEDNRQINQFNGYKIIYDNYCK